MCFGQRFTERVSAKSDITVLGEASSQIHLNQQTTRFSTGSSFMIWTQNAILFAVSWLEVIYIQYAELPSVVISEVHLFYPIRPSLVGPLSWKKKKKSGFYSSLSSENMLTIISSCKNSSKICHPNIITLFCTVLDQKLSHAHYKSRVHKGNSSSSLKCYLYCQLSFHKCVFKSEI